MKLLNIMGILLVAIAVTGCATNFNSEMAKYQKEYEEDERQYRDGLSAVQIFRVSEDECSGTDLATAKFSLTYLSMRESYFYSLQLWSSHRDIHRMKMGVHFSLADAAKEKNFYDIADNLYRDIITTYTGSSYAGIRDRAKLGIDDIKEARQRQ